MKYLLLLFLLLLTFKKASSQMATTDVGATAQLVSIGGVLAQLSGYQKDISERLETVEAIKQISKVAELAEVLSQTYCVIKDYKLFLSLDTEHVSSCFYDFEIDLSMNIIKTSLSQITAAITNTSLSLEERSNMITNAVTGIKVSTEEINHEKELLEAKQKLKEQMEDMIRFYSN